MELWIRSQNKKKIEKVNKVEIYGYFDIVVNGNADDIFGTYSEERALEVLDEIQKLFEPKIILKSIKEIAQTLDGVYYTNPDEYEIEQLSSYVYQMPEE